MALRGVAQRHQHLPARAEVEPATRPASRDGVRAQRACPAGSGPGRRAAKSAYWSSRTGRGRPARLLPAGGCLAGAWQKVGVSPGRAHAIARRECPKNNSKSIFVGGCRVVAAVEARAVGAHERWREWTAAGAVAKVSPVGTAKIRTSVSIAEAARKNTGWVNCEAGGEGRRSAPSGGRRSRQPDGARPSRHGRAACGFLQAAQSAASGGRSTGRERGRRPEAAARC